eukprot:CAMPEP_0183345614 /NCGR_PEP_ID=MMETSP0164_2-20130417/10992_1 /TAXON_ID=221442 /ORGANISM="Coccolithus pelagicus ssp braarudi, Strain PLY182g" /LENGTH=358 /DNA_ID=CAMNT_0025516775 /DNA_START=67 /DNA_END=1143 /DNA_ORIENTATION=-
MGASSLALLHLISVVRATEQCADISHGAPEVPLVDVSAFVNTSASEDERLEAAQEWDRAMTDVGFALITGHGVQFEIVNSMRVAANHFFMLPQTEKGAYTHGPYGHPSGGYTFLGGESVARTRDEHGSDGGAESVQDASAPDLVESYIFHPHSPIVQPPSLAAAAAAYHTELLRVLHVLNRLTAAALSLPADYFQSYYSPTPEVSLRLAYYPPLPPGSDNSSAVRYGAHTDYTGFTILLQDEADLLQGGGGGLQVRPRSGRSWLSVKPRPDAFVVNIGDLYEVWTNGRWRSTVHRVLKPLPDSAAAGASRLSIPFFTGPRNDAVIEALSSCVDEKHPQQYEPVTAGEHLQRKLRGSVV